MKTIEARIPETVLRQAEELAAREQIPLDQVISLAVTQGLSAWSNESKIPDDIEVMDRQADREKFLDALTEALNAEPVD
jgi:antitoxin component of RelBE/YafQ-DinJ toxin-antitoxin module